MSKNITVLVLAASLTFLWGCTKSFLCKTNRNWSVTYSDTNPNTQEIIAGVPLDVSAITFIREPQFVACAGRMFVQIDGEEVGPVATHTHVVVYVPPGEHEDERSRDQEQHGENRVGDAAAGRRQEDIGKGKVLQPKDEIYSIRSGQMVTITVETVRPKGHQVTATWTARNGKVLATQDTSNIYTARKEGPDVVNVYLFDETNGDELEGSIVITVE